MFEWVLNAPLKLPLWLLCSISFNLPFELYFHEICFLGIFTVILETILCDIMELLYNGDMYLQVSSSVSLFC